MTSPQTELEKAIERLSDDSNEYVQQLLLAVKRISELEQRLKEVEKERDALKEQVTPGFFGRLAAKKSIELSNLRTDYKKALEALKSANVQLKTHIALVENVDKKAVRQRLMFRDVIEQNDEALSHPAVQQILNKKSI